MITTQLRHVLEEIRGRGGPTFSGVGLLISGAPGTLPIVGLRGNVLPDQGGGTINTLARISNDMSEFHDGFHVLSPDFELLRTSQYFSPPIIADLPVDSDRKLGGRYMAALFGSALPGVLASGVASREYGVAVFENGQEVRDSQ